MMRRAFSLLVLLVAMASGFMGCEPGAENEPVPAAETGATGTASDGSEGSDAKGSDSKAAEE